MNKILVVIIYSTLLSACCTPIPGRIEKFEPITQFVTSVPEKNDATSQYFIGDTYVKMFMSGENATNFRENSPYWIGVSILKDNYTDTEVTLLDYKIRINGKEIDGFRFSRSGGKSEEYLPITFFNMESQSPIRNQVIVSPVSVLFEKTEVIVVDARIRVRDKRGEKVKTIQYSFFPKLERVFCPTPIV